MIVRAVNASDISRPLKMDVDDHLTVIDHIHDLFNQAGVLQILASAQAVNAETTLYTVPASRRGFIFTHHMNVVNAGGAAASGVMRIYNAVPAIAMSFSFTVGANSSSANNNAYPVPLYLAAGWSIRIFSNAANLTANLAVTGIEEGLT